MNFADAARNVPNKLTENGQPAFSNLNNPVLELFAQVGALRNRTPDVIKEKFIGAFNFDPALTIKMLFYAGNVRGGLGERRTFRIGLKALANYAPKYIKNNLGLIPFFNRWDTVLSLIGTPVEKDMWKLVCKQLKNDVESAAHNKPISLLAKWLPSENTSSQETRQLAREVMKNLDVTPRTYRKTLSKLRKYIDVVERKMSGQEWDKIKYDAVPSYAMKNYSKAFTRHDNERFSTYIEGLKSGKTKINSATLYPYDIAAKVEKIDYSDSEARQLLDAQWNGLPNYVEGENNYIVMADVSGSMYGRPIQSSTSLAAYFAERNKGVYHNLFMTFTDIPRFCDISGKTDAFGKLSAVYESPVGYNTNLEAAFDLVLETAIRNGILQVEMPKAIIVISDMEIDWILQRDLSRPDDFFSQIESRFNRAGYEMPKLICWNVEARKDTFLSKNPNLIYVSGNSPSTFKELTGALNGKTSWDIMIETLNNPIYDCIWTGKS